MNNNKELSVKIPWGLWKNESFNLRFPEAWDVSLCEMQGGTSKTLSEINKMLKTPAGLSWDKITYGAKSACIAIDDITRPTPTKKILPGLCRELFNAGIMDVTVIIGLGCHRPLNQEEMSLKISEEYINKCHVINHNPYNGTINIGESLHGTPLELNKAFYQADVKIVIGGVTPNYMAGFGGGAKVVLPGIAGIKSIGKSHGLVKGFDTGNINQPLRKDMEEFAEILGIDLAVNVVMNEKSDIGDMYVGDLQETYTSAVNRARSVYSTSVDRKADILILNAYPKDTELTQIRNAFNPIFSTKNIPITPDGTIVVTACAWDGIGFHSMYGDSKDLVESHLRKTRDHINNDICLFVPHNWVRVLNPGPGIRIYDKWDELLVYLKKSYGENACVRILPSASLQILS